MSKDYNYYKEKYKTVTIKLDRQADADVIKYLEEWPKGPKHLIVWALRTMKKFMRGGLSI